MNTMESRKVDADHNKDRRPSLSFKLKLPFKVEKLFVNPAGQSSNTYQLFGIESDRIKGKEKGLWCTFALFECMAERSLFFEPDGPDFFELVPRGIAAGGWATADDLKPPRALASMDVEGGGGGATLFSSAAKRQHTSTDEQYEQERKSNRKLAETITRLKDSERSLLDRAERAEVDVIAKRVELSRQYGENETLKRELNEALGRAHAAEQYVQEMKAKVSKHVAYITNACTIAACEAKNAIEKASKNQADEATKHAQASYDAAELAANAGKQGCGYEGIVPV